MKWTDIEIFSSPICSLSHPPSSPMVIGSWMSLAHPGHTVSICAFNVSSSFTNDGTSPVSSFNLYSRSSTSDSSWTLVRSGVECDRRFGDLRYRFIARQFAIGAGTALPVELVSFSGSSEELDAELTWTTATEVDNYGFEVQRSPVGNKSSAQTSAKAGFVKEAERQTYRRNIHSPIAISLRANTLTDSNRLTVPCFQIFS